MNQEKTYPDLVDEIAALHQRYLPPVGFVPHPLAINGQWIPSVVDSTTHNVLGKQPIIVAFGANYATGANQLPTSASAMHRTTNPWVEEKLGQCRTRSINFLNACAQGKGHVKHHWNGLMPFDWDQAYASGIVTHIGNDPHFVMTNASPWVTSQAWAKIRGNSLEDMFGILATPGMGRGDLWSYFRDLKKCVGPHAVWIGHGNAEIYGIFRLLCGELEIRNWFFDSNLSQKSWMTLP